MLMSYQASSVPKWVADKLQSAITKNLTLPSCADIPLPYLLPVDHPDAGAALPGFLHALHSGTHSVSSSACCSVYMQHPRWALAGKDTSESPFYHKSGHIKSAWHPRAPSLIALLVADWSTRSAMSALGPCRWVGWECHHARQQEGRQGQAPEGRLCQGRLCGQRRQHP